MASINEAVMKLNRVGAKIELKYDQVNDRHYVVVQMGTCGVLHELTDTFEQVILKSAEYIKI